MDKDEILESLQSSFDINSASSGFMEIVNKTIKLSQQIDCKKPLEFCINNILLNFASTSLNEVSVPKKDTVVLNKMRIYCFGF